MSARGHILIVEDDEAIASGLALNLGLEGFDTGVIGDGAEAFETIRAEQPRLVLLDITLPNRNGLEVLHDLREVGDSTPVIILSARQAEFDKVAALRLGADDYVTKPFGVAELLARIEAVLRRLDASGERAGAVAAGSPGAGRETDALLRFGDIEVDPDTHEVTRGGAPVRLTRLEFDLLRYFLEHPSKVFERQHLLHEVWGVAHKGPARTVDNFVAQLRQKLEPDPNEPRHFVTVRGSGYRFDP
ncbi:MAG: response regulator transcription factor [Planctomycetes bacterium]|nr:response regulator transcription factor [Planctomycetota bacterium]